MIKNVGHYIETHAVLVLMRYLRHLAPAYLAVQLHLNEQRRRSSIHFPPFLHGFEAHFRSVTQVLTFIITLTGIIK